MLRLQKIWPLIGLLCLCLIIVNAVQAKQKDAQNQGTPLSPVDKQHILQDNFVLIRTVHAMPTAVQTTLLGSHGRGDMADAGQPFAITDVVGPKPLPFRRLIFAALSLKYCLVYNEYGGIAYGTQVSLYQLSGTDAILVWQAYVLQGGRKVFDLQQLRDAIDKGKCRSEQLPKQPKAS